MTKQTVSTLALSLVSGAFAVLSATGYVQAQTVDEGTDAVADTDAYNTAAYRGCGSIYDNPYIACLNLGNIPVNECRQFVNGCNPGQAACINTRRIPPAECL